MILAQQRTGRITKKSIRCRGGPSIKTCVDLPTREPISYCQRGMQPKPTTGCCEWTWNRSAGPVVVPPLASTLVQTLFLLLGPRLLLSHQVCCVLMTSMASEPSGPRGGGGGIFDYVWGPIAANFGQKNCRGPSSWDGAGSPAFFCWVWFSFFPNRGARSLGY